MKHTPPVIGINCDYDESKRGSASGGMLFVEAIEHAGGTPLFLPAVGPQTLERQLDAVQGVILTGGADLPAQRAGMEPRPEIKPISPRRADYDLALMKAITRRSIPVFAVCLGIQELNAAFGGTLVADIPADVPHALIHRVRDNPRAHTVNIVAGTRVASILGVTALEVNSTHHQAVLTPGKGLKVSARAPDDVIEAIELDSERFVIGVQWHPERLLDREPHARLFEALVEAASGELKRRSTRRPVPRT